MRCFSWVFLSLLFFSFDGDANAVEDNSRTLDNEEVEQMLSAIQASVSEIKEQLYDNVAVLDEAYREIRQVELASLASFSQRRGRLPWPVKGRLRHHYGSTRIHNERWKGLYIATSIEESVHAPHAGRVVFADWLKGFGLLMIIDHQDGYMTLYGNNAVLLKKTGEMVRTGDVIATTGFGYQGYGLYFEIRKNGVPIDPKRWLSNL